jgi:hypothetical protein
LIDWGSELEDYSEHERRMEDLSPSASGNYIHALLENEFGDVPGLSFEEEISTGRVDLLTDNLLYEFKTKSDYNMCDAPLMDDVEQVRRYLNSPDIQHDEAILTYINRRTSQTYVSSSLIRSTIRTLWLMADCRITESLICTRLIWRRGVLSEFKEKI